MSNPTPSRPRKTFSEGIYAIEPAGYLTGSLGDARRVCAAQGGFLFRVGHLFLVGEYEEAINWGWSPKRKDRHG